MTEIHAKPIVDGKFWIVEQDGERVATLHKKENVFIMSGANGDLMVKEEELKKYFGSQFFLNSTEMKVSTPIHECYGYPTSYTPHNAMYDIKRKIPLFSKSDQSKSLYCAGYYAIKFNKNWVKSFCPKAITLERYPFKGPFKNELELKTVLSNAKSD